MRTSQSVSIAVSLIALATAGCGGGGGGGSGSGSTAQGPTLTISSANAPRVTEAAMATTNATDVANVGGGLAGSPGAAATSAAVAKRAAKRLSAHAVAQRQIPDTQPCDTPPGGVAGSIDFIFNDADNDNDVSRNDTIDATLKNCFLADVNVTGNGRLSLRITAFSNTSLGIAAQYTNFALDASGTANDMAIDGNLDFTATKPSATTAQVVIDSGTFTVKDANDTVTLSAPSLTLTGNTTTKRYAIVGGATVTSQALGGTFTYNIPSSAPLTGTGSANPDSGTINIVGVNSNVVVTALGGNNVRLDIDTTGDKVADESRTVTWDEIII
jgi:hypothetical protein